MGCLGELGFVIVGAQMTISRVDREGATLPVVLKELAHRLADRLDRLGVNAESTGICLDDLFNAGSRVGYLGQAQGHVLETLVDRARGVEPVPCVRLN